jgi:Tfp pilus assembly protein PilP
MKPFDSLELAQGRPILLVICFGVLLAAPVLAQAPPAPAPAPAQAPAPQAPTSPDAPPTPPPNYTYSPDSRRDPFVSLFNRGTGDSGPAAGKVRPEGIAGLAVDEVVIRGIVQSRGGWVAVVGAPNGRTYTVRAGDRLLDGSVRAINATTVILLQEVNDPLSLEKQREVRKYLRGEVK